MPISMPETMDNFFIMYSQEDNKLPSKATTNEAPNTQALT